VLVSNPSQLEALDPKTHVIRIASSVGAKKRGEIIKRAEELGLKVLNAS
jgi:large subunit ribosomal protein L32e